MTRKAKWLSYLMAALLLTPVVFSLSGLDSPLFGQEAAPAEEVAPAAAEEAPVSDEMFTVNNVWMMVATFLVFIMHLGFAMLETGLTQAKNTVNILFKNTMIIAIGLLTYALIGFNLMYPDFTESANVIIGGVFGFAGWGIGFADADAAANITQLYGDGGYTYWTDFLFQGMFAATAATIVSGAVAERIKLSSFLVFSLIYVAVIYPIIGSWQWGGGFLSVAVEDGGVGFYDFAGSTLVHSVGGWAALAGVIVLGARTGKYTPAGISPIPGHSMPLATVGMFLLWLGWFGFNGGSVLSADPAATSFTLVTTCMAAAAGIVGSTVLSWIISGKPDLSMALNGALAGLVGITAGADSISVMNSVYVGFIAGLLVVGAVILFDMLKLDDPVGAISVHLVCGIWGTLAVGIFSDAGTFGGQMIGVLSAAALAFPAALIIFLALKLTIGLRVDKEEELKGLDVGEHGQEAYGGFQIYDLR